MAVTFPTLDQIDPAEAWQPWQPTPADPWGRKWAAHLYRRAAFGASREDLLEAERLGLQGTLDLLCQGRPDADGGRWRLWSMSAASPPMTTTAATNSAAGGSTACSRAAIRCARR